MKLNKKTTVLVGLAFLSISAFWQMYDNVIPLMLKGTFHLDEALTGAVMAADNILALFLLPFFGALSDRTSTKIGRRMPFILGGTAAAVVLMNLLPLLDNRYAAAPSPAARAAFVVLLGLLLIAMGTYRSPAVALMPDVTVKPLRSKGNAIINLMGAVGGVLYLAAASLLYSDARMGHLAHVDYRLLFAIVSAIMVLSVLILFLTVREPALAAQTARYEAAHPEEDLSEGGGSGAAALPPPVRRSLIFLLLSISLWYIAYNAVTTWFTTYVQELMGRALGGASTCLMVATAGAIVSYIPIGEISSRVGRKRTILGGVVLLSQLPAHGGGDVPRQRRGEVHRNLLHLLHGRPGGDAGALRLAPKPRGILHPLPLRRPLLRRVLCHHALRPPRRQQNRAPPGLGGLRRRRLIKRRNQ